MIDFQTTPKSTMSYYLSSRDGDGDTVHSNYCRLSWTFHIFVVHVSNLYTCVPNAMESSVEGSAVLEERDVQISTAGRCANDPL